MQHYSEKGTLMGVDDKTGMENFPGYRIITEEITMNIIMHLAADFADILSPISGILVGISAVFAGWFVWNELPSEEDASKKKDV